MHKIDDNLAKVTARIQEAALAAGRNPETVDLLAVSKTQPAHIVAAAYAAGARKFGENYLQEALDKKNALLHLADIEWHFIGPIQSNKTRLIAENFDWVHSIDREKTARRLSEQRPASMAPIHVCIQVNIDQEESKAGVTLAELPALAKVVASLPALELRGLMAIPAPCEDPQQQACTFRRVNDALQALKSDGLIDVDTLSMGMSGDLEVAIAQGATIVRVGTDIFGARPVK